MVPQRVTPSSVTTEIVRLTTVILAVTLSFRSRYKSTFKISVTTKITQLLAPPKLKKKKKRLTSQFRALQWIVTWHWSSCLNTGFEGIWMSADYGRRNSAKFNESKSLPTSTINLQFNIFFYINNKIRPTSTINTIINIRKYAYCQQLKKININKNSSFLLRRLASQPTSYIDFNNKTHSAI